MEECDYQIARLTDAFYEAYPDPPYKEILRKRKRGYQCLLFQSHYEYFVCIPYRTEIQHPYAYKFRNSLRSRCHASGLDYTKTVIIADLEYLDSEKMVIDHDEYKETVIQIERIKEEALEFLEDYIRYQTGDKFLHPREYFRRYQYSTLPYFDDILIKP